MAVVIICVVVAVIVYRRKYKVRRETKSQDTAQEMHEYVNTRPVAKSQDTAEEMHEYVNTRPVAPKNTVYESLEGSSTLDVNVSFMLKYFVTMYLLNVKHKVRVLYHFDIQSRYYDCYCLYLNVYSEQGLLT